MRYQTTTECINHPDDRGDEDAQEVARSGSMETFEADMRSLGLATPSEPLLRRALRRLVIFGKGSAPDLDQPDLEQ